jgi:hypothetical protein
MELLSLAGDLRQLDGRAMFGHTGPHACPEDQLMRNVHRCSTHSRAGAVTGGASGRFGASDGHACAVATVRGER